MRTHLAQAATTTVLVVLVAACSAPPLLSPPPASVTSPSNTGSTSRAPTLAATPTATPTPAAIIRSIEPSAQPIRAIEHPLGPMEVVLRLDSGPDLGASELTGEFFQPGPEFTLYGDGTVIYRNLDARLPARDGPILRAAPFTLVQLDDGDVQSLLRFAIGEGGLTTARDRYETQDTDGFGSVVLTVRTRDLEKRIEVAGPSPLGALIERLIRFDPGDPATTRVWTGDRHWGSLLDVAPYLESGVLPDPDDAGTLPWPWPNIDPDDFVGRDEGGYIGQPRRVMTAKEARALGLSDHGGLVQRVYLVGPDRETVYSFSLWPMSPDERS